MAVFARAPCSSRCLSHQWVRIGAGSSGDVVARGYLAGHCRRLDDSRRRIDRHKSQGCRAPATHRAGCGIRPGHGALSRHPADAHQRGRRIEPGRRLADADGHAVVCAVQRHCRRIGHPARPELHHRVIAGERLGTLAHADLARAVPVSHHRHDHRGRRRVERQHRGRVCHLWRADSLDNRRGRVDRRSNRYRQLYLAARRDTHTHHRRHHHQSLVLAAVCIRLRKTKYRME